MKYRHCKNCEKGTMQYSEKRNPNNSKSGIAERLFFGVFILWMTELIMDKYWICAECGEEQIG